MTFHVPKDFKTWAILVGWLSMIGWAIWTTSSDRSSALAAVNINRAGVKTNQEAIAAMREWREHFLPKYESDMATVKNDVRWLCLQRDPNYRSNFERVEVAP